MCTPSPGMAGMGHSSYTTHTEHWSSSAADTQRTHWQHTQAAQVAKHAPCINSHLPHTPAHSTAQHLTAQQEREGTVMQRSKQRSTRGTQETTHNTNTQRHTTARQQLELKHKQHRRWLAPGHSSTQGAAAPPQQPPTTHPCSQQRLRTALAHPAPLAHAPPCMRPLCSPDTIMSAAAPHAMGLPVAAAAQHVITAHVQRCPLHHCSSNAHPRRRQAAQHQAGSSRLTPPPPTC
jgi:hypothetical protein